MIDIDDRDLALMQKALKKEPDRFKFYVVKMLNDMAFGVRKEIVEHGIPDEMIVRNKGLVRSHVRVFKADKNQSISNLYSKVFSIKDDRFTGWFEQEKGGVDKRKRVATVAGRQGSKTRKIPGKYRLTDKGKFPHSSNFPGKNRHLKNVIMMQILSRINVRHPFIISGHNKLRPGLYKFEGSRGNKPWFGKQKIRLLQAFDRAPSSIKKRPWMSHSLRAYFHKKDWFKPFEKFLINFGKSK